MFSLTGLYCFLSLQRQQKKGQTQGIALLIGEMGHSSYAKGIPIDPVVLVLWEHVF